MRDKRGISTIIVTVILVGLVLVAIGVVWVVISNLLKSGTQQTQSSFGQLLINLKLQNVVLKSNGDVDVGVTRNVGAGTLTAINFVVSDGTNIKVIKKSASLAELDSGTFTLTAAEIGSMNIKTVSIAPVLNVNGEESVGNIIDTYSLGQVALNSQTNPGTSCKDILLRHLSNGDGIYWVNATINSPFQVYCDMTTDDGGWTLAAVCKPDGNPVYPLFYDTNGDGYTDVPLSGCWNNGAVGSALDPNSPTTTKLADSNIIAILTHGENVTRGHWTQKYQLSVITNYDGYIYNNLTDPTNWSSNGGGLRYKQFYVKYTYAGSWGSVLLTNFTTCSSASNGWSNQNFNGHGESCGSLGAWNAGCENGPSASHSCGNANYDERANVTVYIR